MIDNVAANNIPGQPVSSERLLVVSNLPKKWSTVDCFPKSLVADLTPSVHGVPNGVPNKTPSVSKNTMFSGSNHFFSCEKTKLN